MGDQLDLAQELDARFRKQALIARKKKTQAGRAMESRTICVDCDEEIPERRRQAVPGCIRCTDCEQEWENENL
jgi:phage/conjugal plasmid C-4 type zinc finger TraR family protein